MYAKYFLGVLALGFLLGGCATTGILEVVSRSSSGSAARPEARTSSLEHVPKGAEALELPSGERGLRFFVVHLHGQGFAGRCYGQLDVLPDRIEYTPFKDHPEHAFTVDRGELRASAPPFGPNVLLKLPAETHQFIVVDRSMVEQVRNVLLTRIHLNDRMPLVAALNTPQSGGALRTPASTARAPVSFVRNWETQFTTRLSGVYRLEEQLDFNVLDGAWFDATRGQVTLFGYRDAKYLGPQIPYLQHLAALLENPRPEMTLDWTPDSERRVRAFLDRRETRADAQRAAREMAQFLDAQGRVNDTGRLLLPGWGIKPVRNSASRRGYLGVQVVQQGEAAVCVTAVADGSPAARAGIRRGDIISGSTWGSPLTPTEFNRNIGYSGEGYKISLQINQEGEPLWVTLAGTNEDPWAALDRDEVIFAILRAAGKGSLAHALDSFHRQDRTLKTPAETTAFVLSIDDLGLTQAWQEAVNRHGRTVAMQLELYAHMNARLEKLFEVAPGTFSEPFEAAYRRTNNIDVANRAFSDVFHAQREHMVDSALTRLRSRAQGVQIAPELVDRTWGVHPEVRPRFMGVRADTQLARVMLAGDYLGKRLVNLPTLKEKIPGYQTQYEYLRRHPADDRDRAAYRMWISVDRFQAAQSPDRSTFLIRDIAMRFNIRELDARGAGRPTTAGGYEEMLSGMYEELSQEFFVLHELREAAKLAAIAEWIRGKVPDFRLPDAGRSNWQAPDKLPGMVFVYLGGGDANGTADMTTFATGGVALTPYEGWGPVFKDGMAPVDASVVDLRHLPRVSPGPTASAVSLPTYTNTELRRVLKTAPVPPEWHPDGWVAAASSGQATLRTVSVLRNRETARGDTIDQHEKIELLQALGHRLTKVDALLNAVNARSPELQQQIDRTVAELEGDRQRYIEHSLAILRQCTFGLRSELKPGTLAQSTEGAAQLKELEEKFESWSSRLEALRSRSPQRQVEELAGLAGELAEAAEGLADSPVLGPMLRVMNTASRMKDIAGLGSGLLKVYVVSDYDVRKLTEDADTRLRAVDSLTSYRQKLLDDIRKLEADPALQQLQP